jgi:CMP-N,N'-diacetyllegionaminic acid synthase
MDFSIQGLILIPARGGSKGVIRKNLQKVHDVPLVIRSLNHALHLNNLTKMKICVSSDDLEILKLCKTYLGVIGIKTTTELNFNDNVVTLHKRQKNLSSDKSLIGSLIKELSLSVNKFNFENFSWVLMQPTTPFRSKTDFVNVVNRLKKLKDLDSVVSVERVIEYHPSRMYTRSDLRLEPLLLTDYYSRRQDLSETYIRDGAFYAFSQKLALEGLTYSFSPNFFDRKMPWTINIDSEFTLLLSQQIPRESVVDDPNNSINYNFDL